MFRLSGKSVLWAMGVVFLATFILVRWYLGTIFDLRAVCEDGWRSGSIGTQGACSYHGGVDRSAAFFAFVGSLLSGLFAVWICFKAKVIVEVLEEPKERLSVIETSELKVDRLATIPISGENSKNSEKQYTKRPVQLELFKGPKGRATKQRRRSTRRR